MRMVSSGRFSVFSAITIRVLSQNLNPDILVMQPTQN